MPAPRCFTHPYPCPLPAVRVVTQLPPKTKRALVGLSSAPSVQKHPKKRREMMAGSKGIGGSKRKTGVTGRSGREQTRPDAGGDEDRAIPYGMIRAAGRLGASASWTTEDVDLLEEIIERDGKRPSNASELDGSGWDAIAATYNTTGSRTRTAEAIKSKFKDLLKNSDVGGWAAKARQQQVTQSTQSPAKASPKSSPKRSPKHSPAPPPPAPPPPAPPPPAATGGTPTVFETGLNERGLRQQWLRFSVLQNLRCAPLPLL